MVDPPASLIRRRKRNRKADALTSDILAFLTAKAPPNDAKAVGGATLQLGPEYDNTVVYIGHGCLLIPAMFLVWWYWTKRTARRVVHGVITFTHRGSRSSSSMSIPGATTICNNGDNVDIGPCFDGCTSPESSSHIPNESRHHYQSWEDTLPAESSSSSDDPLKFRFIHWMKRTKRSRTRQAVRMTTLHNLHNNDMPKHEWNEKYISDIPTLPKHGHAFDKAKDKNGSQPNIITQIQTPSHHSTPSGIEMFVIEYPQQMSHPAHKISMI